MEHANAQALNRDLPLGGQLPRSGHLARVMRTSAGRALRNHAHRRPALAGMPELSGYASPLPLKMIILGSDIVCVRLILGTRSLTA